MENLMAELLPVTMGKTKGLKAVFMKKRYRFFGSAAAILLLWNLCLGPFPPGGSAPYHWERDLEAIHGVSYSGRVVSVLDEGGQRVPEDLSCSVERAHPFTLRQGIAAALTRSLADETGAVLKTGRQVWTYAGYSDCDYHSTRPAWLAAEGVRLSWERFALP
ncbi:hypothetical protein [Pusillibacter faecalis]|nr:hypothetical protein [Pusillibacter faecalis]